MNAKKGLTRADVIISAACLVLLVVNIQAISAGGRGRSKREVCMANLRALTAGWQMYAEDNNGKVPVGDVWYSWSFPGTPGTSLAPQLAWHEWPHPWPHSMPPSQGTNQVPLSDPTYGGFCVYNGGCKEPAWQHATAEGTLWKYIKDYKIYRCPVAAKDQYVTYAMAHSMNTYPGSGGPSAPTITNINQITHPAERFVFLDAGFAKQGAFFVKYSGGNVARWYDLPPMRHDRGTTFSFADGHVIYRKWTDPHALAAAESGIWGGGPEDNCDCDLRWFSKATWGKLSSEWEPCTSKNCAD